MPSTLNGVGTKYYGKKNISSRVGQCSHCGQTTQIDSYDTRLWFCLVFIPVIPLGKKRIVNYCAKCTMHHAIPLVQWESQKQLGVSGAGEKFRSNPTPENALELHEHLIGFDQHQEAAEFRKIMEEKFPDDAKVFEGMGLSLINCGQVQEAEKHFARAHELRPDLPTPRMGIADKYIREGRLDEARSLLDFMEKPGSGQLYKLGSIEDLGNAYLAKKSYLEALELYHHLLRELPAEATHVPFRKKVEQCEKALGRKKETILPEKKFSWRALFASSSAPAPGQGVNMGQIIKIGAVCALILLSLGIYNEWVRRHRTLHVVNNLGKPVTVEIAGMTEIIPPGGPFPIKLSEGKYQVIMRGGVEEQIDITLKSDYISRWGGKSVWVLNPGGAAAIERITTVYSKNPESGGSISYETGRFIAMTDIDHPFEPLPTTVKMKSSEKRRYLKGTDVYKGPPSELVDYLAANNMVSNALDYAEANLRLGYSEELLNSYVKAGYTAGQYERLYQFLKPGLAILPVNMEWHRHYQTVGKKVQGDALEAEYLAMLEKEPDNSALTYLCGRLMTDHAESVAYFKRSIKQDAENPFPYLALGYDALNRADFTAAAKLLDKAYELAPDNYAIGITHDYLPYALRSYDDLEQELRERMDEKPMDVGAAFQVCTLLLHQNKREQATEVLKEAEKRLIKEMPKDAPYIMGLLNQAFQMQSQDYATLEKELTKDKSDEAKEKMLRIKLQQGKVEEAMKMPSAAKLFEADPENGLVYALAWKNVGNDAECKAWCDKTAEGLRAGDADDRRAAQLLTAGKAPTIAQLDEVVMQLEWKATLVALFGIQYKDRPELTELARKLNYFPGYPHVILIRALDPAAGRVAE